ncbi:MAG: hypothetical protein AB1589_20580 [Cyanobacteriota bacterium]
MKQGAISPIYDFQPRQIVCLEHETTRLYADVVEVIASRQICWVRPLMLVVSSEDDNPLTDLSSEQLRVYDLRQGADLLWPASLFRAALDTEVISLLVELENPDALKQDNNLDAHKQLSCFVRKVWQAYRSAFSAL